MVFDPDGGGNRAVKQPHPVAVADYRTEPWSARIGERDRRRFGRRDAGRGQLRAGDFTGAGARGEAAHRPVVPSEIPDGQDAGASSAGPLRRDRHPRRHHPRAGRLGRQRQPQLGQSAHPGVRVRAGVRVRRRSAFQPEIVTAHAALGPLRLPATTLFVLRHAGREYAVRSVLAARRTRGSYRPFTWTFGGRVGGVEMRGEITTQPGDVIGLRYTDTNGGTKYCYNPRWRPAGSRCRVPEWPRS